jgi:hypothetical protein
VPTKDEDLEAMITATSTVTPGKGVRKPIPIPQDFGPFHVRLNMPKRTFMTRVVDRLADWGFGLMSAIEWVIQHAVSIAITLAMLAFGTYWAVSTAYLIGANR